MGYSDYELDADEQHAAAVEHRRKLDLNDPDNWRAIKAHYEYVNAISAKWNAVMAQKWREKKTREEKEDE